MSLAVTACPLSICTGVLILSLHALVGQVTLVELRDSLDLSQMYLPSTSLLIIQ